MAPTRGYHSYRGRGSKGKIVLAVLLVLVILAALCVIAMQRYVVYDEDGRPHLELPSRESGDSGNEEEPQEELDLTIQGPERPKEIYALSSAQTPLTTEGWQEEKMELLASSTFSNAVAVTMKDDSGHVYYDSAAAAAVSGSIVRTDATTAAAISDLNASYDYTIARLSCFLDPIASKADVEGLGLKNTGGYIFYDGNDLNWLDPGKAAARTYLCSLAKELAELGFDEILLTDVSYPTEGKLDKIYYGETMKAENLETFLDEMQAALAEYDVTLSLELPSSVVTEGSDNIAGLLLADVASRVDRIYVETDADQAADLAAAVNQASAETSFAAELTQPAQLPEGLGYLILPEE